MTQTKTPGRLIAMDLRRVVFSDGRTPTRSPQGWVKLSGISAATLLGLVMVLEVSGLVTGFDTTIARWTSELRTPAGLAVARVVTWFGSLVGVVTAALLAALILARRVLRLLESLVLLTSIVVGSSLMYLLKLAISRERPSTAFALGEATNDFSFPSGHTTIGTTVLLLAALLIASTVTRPSLRSLIVGLGVLAGTLIGLSRLYLGYHWATDIIGGWLLALTLSAAAMTILTATDTRRV